jgi:hypothetical protein
MSSNLVILDTLKGVAVLGIHSVALALPILFEEAEAQTAGPSVSASGEADAVATPVTGRSKAAGLFNPAWEVIDDLDPQWLDEFLAMGAGLYRGVLPAKLVELMATAVDASCTHLYAPGPAATSRAPSPTAPPSRRSWRSEAV